MIESAWKRMEPQPDLALIDVQPCLVYFTLPQEPEVGVVFQMQDGDTDFCSVNGKRYRLRVYIEEEQPCQTT